MLKTRQRFLIDPLNLLYGFLGVGAAFFFSGRSEAIPPVRAITNVSVVDVAAGIVRDDQTVVFDGERIRAAGPAASVRVSGDAGVVNGRGKFVIPGLWDLHVNLRTDRLKEYPAHGILSVLDVATPWARLKALRESVRQKGDAPNVIASGAAVDSRTPREARETFDHLWDVDADFITVSPTIARDAYVALAEQARHWRLRFAGPVPASISLSEAINARQSSIEGFDKIASLPDADAIAFFRQCALYGIRVSPMLAEQKRARPGDAVALGRWYRLTTFAKQARTELIAGSGEGASPGSGLLEELEQLAAAGLTPKEVLESATIAPAALAGRNARIEAGGASDLVVLNANPLKDVRNVRQVYAVVLRGQYYPQASLAR